MLSPSVPTSVDPKQLSLDLESPCKKCDAVDWYVSPQGNKSCRPCQRAGIRKYQQSEKGKAAIRRWQEKRGPEYMMAAAAKARAARAGVPFAITAADIRGIWPADGRCPALGIPLVWGLTGRGIVPGSATLDRISPKAGYVSGNIAILSHQANRIKTDATAADILAVAEWTAEQEERQQGREALGALL